ncbi:efflux RND transporter periplasmic adaptor subunit [Chryseobacterium gotjawalense]|uniref:Efflux RND transporter periplasmic adaptor subunit n=1 Tax=Chryseobacterium gotjawalense TaxID=3042315 RepID=A0ABY8RF60_9FLAO|nr:efflux RND transporter periplasmic adaptor subunit [Chryseobacterium sp. wdc7]WHF52169.1 efflux RND transporter periplasmic adaptor subunit [Chryseobacterium sp. wdc7]
MKKRTLFTILAIIIIGAGFYWILQNNKKKNQQEVAIVAEKNTDVAVRTAPVKREEISGEFTVNGTFLPNKQSQIASEINGQLVALYVKEGSYVKAGQSIGRLAGEKLNVTVGNANANLSQAQSALSRYEAAYKTGGVTALQLDQARLQVKNARSQVQSAQLQSGDTNIIAKISGIVNQKMVEVGSVVAPGTPLVEIVDISSLKLKVDVDQALVTQLSLGNNVKVKPDVIDGTIEGRITFIAPSASGALKFPVEITVPNSFNKLKAGMYASAMFNRTGVNSVLVVPRDAFVGSVSDNLIFVVKNNVAYLTKVQSGVNYGDKVEIVSGLNEGEQVVTSGQINLSDKTKIRILK